MAESIRDRNTGGKWSLGAVGFVLILAFIAFGLTFEGLRIPDLNLFVIGLSFALVIGFAISFLGGSMLRGGKMIYFSALGFWLGRGIFHVLDFATGGFQLSLFSLPTETYLSAVGQLGPFATTIVNNKLAADGETLFIIGGALFLLVALLDEGMDPKKAFAIAGTLGGIAFGLLHGAASIAFMLLAGVSFLIWFTTSAGEKVGAVDVPWIATGILFAIGMHEGNNINASGGVVAHYSSLWSAAQSGGFFSISAAAKLIILQDIVFLALALYGVYLIRRDGIDILR